MTATCTKCESTIPEEAAHCPACGADAPTPTGIPALSMAEAMTQPLIPSASDRSHDSIHARLARALGKDYEVRRMVGRGGFAEVYEVWDKNLERRLAIKVLTPDIGWAAGTLERFTQEARVVARLSHQAILPIHFVSNSEGIAYYAMPFIEGQSLRELLDRRHKLPASEAMGIVRPVLEALGHAHDNGLVHRDIKPDNVMIEHSTNRVLLVDFGIAKALDPEKASNLTQAGFAVGTPHFMSPEQALGDAADGRSDLYSVGAMLFEALVGEKAFDAATTQEIVSAHISEPARNPSELDPTIPVRLSDIVMRCLEKRPANRFQNAAEILKALEGADAQLPDVGASQVVQGSMWSSDEFEPEISKDLPISILDELKTAPPIDAKTGGISLGSLISSDSIAPGRAKPTAETASESEQETPASPAPVHAPTPAPLEAVRAPGRLAPLDGGQKPRRSTGLAVFLPLIVIGGLAAWITVGGGMNVLRPLWGRFMQQAVGTNSGAAAGAGGARVIGPDERTQIVTNSLVDRVELSVNGQVYGTLAPGQQDTLPFKSGQPPTLSWTLVRPQQQGGRNPGMPFTQTMVANVQDAEGNQSFSIIASGRVKMFAPIVTNQSNQTLTATINPGTPDERSCNCLIPAGSIGLHIGYYTYTDNSTVAFHIADRGTSGRPHHVERNISQGFQTRSGEARITISR